MNPQYYSLTGYRTTSHILINQGGEIILSGNHWVSFELTAIVQELTGTGEIDWQWIENPRGRRTETLEPQRLQEGRGRRMD